MRKIGDKANGSVIQRPNSLHSTAISNRKSGIRIRPKSQELNKIQISNRKYSPLLRSPWRIAILDRDFDRSPHVLIYGSAIKSPRNIFKTSYIAISNRR